MRFLKIATIRYNLKFDWKRRPSFLAGILFLFLMGLLVLGVVLGGLVLRDPPTDSNFRDGPSLHDIDVHHYEIRTTIIPQEFKFECDLKLKMVFKTEGAKNAVLTMGNFDIDEIKLLDGRPIHYILNRGILRLGFPPNLNNDETLTIMMKYHRLFNTPATDAFVSVTQTFLPDVSHWIPADESTSPTV